MSALVVNGAVGGRGEADVDLKAEIRRYVLRNTAAAETPNGVMRAWLKLAPGEHQLWAIEEALEDLVTEGFLEHHHLPGGATIYRRAQPAPRS